MAIKTLCRSKAAVAIQFRTEQMVLIFINVATVSMAIFMSKHGGIFKISFLQIPSVPIASFYKNKSTLN